MAAVGELLGSPLRASCAAVARLAVMVFCVVIPNGCFVRCPQEGNLISIGPGMYPSNRTLDGGGRSILVLGSCEFMHNGTLTGLNYYVASNDWMILQIWRPVSMDAVSMMLVYEKMIEPNASVDDITQLRFEDGELHVMEGDRIGFTKLNHTFPIPYIFNPQMSADLWYNRVPAEVSLPNISDVITFEEMGFPYHFSVTVTFKAQVNKNPPIVVRPYRKPAHFNDVMKPAAGDGNKMHDVMMGDAPHDVDVTSNAKHKKLNSIYKPVFDGAESEKSSPEKQDGGDLERKSVGQTAKSYIPAIEGQEEEEEGGEFDAQISLNQTLLPMLTQTVGETTAEEVEMGSAHTSIFTTSDNGPSQRPDLTHSPKTAAAATVVTTEGPKFIFDTVMQTFSNIVQTTEEPNDDTTAGDEHDVTSSSLDMTSSVSELHETASPADVTENRSPFELTSESENTDVTTDSWDSQPSKAVGKTKGLPNDTTD